MFDYNASLSQIVVCNEKYQKVMLTLMRMKLEIEECQPFDATCSLMHDAGTLTPAEKSCYCQFAILLSFKLKAAPNKRQSFKCSVLIENDLSFSTAKIRLYLL